MKKIFIGDVSKKFCLNPRTIRYYENIGLLSKPLRTESGYRLYNKETIERLEFILKAKTLGLKLDEIKEIINLYEKGKVPCECTKKILRNRIKETEEKITNLQELIERLTALLNRKKYKTIKSICPIIEEIPKTS